MPTKKQLASKLARAEFDALHQRERANALSAKSVTLDDRLREAGLRITKQNVGSGGSATVHKAVVEVQRPNLPPIDTAVAVKEYKPSILTIPGQLDRIRQEAQVGLRVDHANIVKTFGLLEPDAQDATSGYVLLLEWIDGETLEQWHTDAVKPIAWETMKALCLEMLAGVAALHQLGIFHRDLKPENVMVRMDGHAVIMDVGVCELTADADHTLHTSLKDFVGSARFASPQFILGEPFKPADDVYSLVTTFYLLFTNKQVFHHVVRKPVIPIYAVTESPSVEGVALGVPPSMKLLLQAGLHRERARRPTLDELRDCLNDPDAAMFLTRELEQQATESRGYPVLEVMKEGASFYADMGADAPDVDHEFVIVRRSGTKIRLASYNNREAVPEQWIARAVLKHVHQNIGHFVTLGKRWQEGRQPRDPLRGMLGGLSALVDPGSPGQWIDFEKSTGAVSRGDIVLKRPY